jgi:F-type H+-transporting ATPase subunit delta
MTNKTAATRYARALLDVAIKEIADLDQIERDLDSVAELFKQYPALAHALLNPVVPVPRKRAATGELTALARLTPIVTKLIGLLADRDRLVLVPDLLTAYRERLLDYRNVIRAEITTSVELPPERAKAIEASLTRSTGRTVALATSVDPSIVGGVVTRIGSTVYDGSIARQLQKIRARLGEGA